MRGPEPAPAPWSLPTGGEPLPSDPHVEGTLLGGEIPLPRLVLRRSALDHNIALMARWCREHGVELAPHAKTTMAPYVIERQLDAGAWGMTAATVEQAARLRQMGVGRIVIANEVVDRAGLRWIAAVNDWAGLHCLVDSVAGVRLMERELAAAGASAPLAVLVELGVAGRRAGCRSDAEALAVARAVADSPLLRLAGVECFEGVLDDAAAVDALLERVAAVTAELRRAELLDPPDGTPLVTAGGSVFFDRVAALRARLLADGPATIVLRSGCYVTHDHGIYERLSPLAAGGGAGDPRQRLRPALELWAEVLSRPDAERAIVGFGRREAPHDAGLPVPLRAEDRDGGAVALGPEAAITGLNDHHAFLADPGRLAVGDRVVLGISHPCTAFDRWRVVTVLDDDDTVVAAARTWL